MAFKNYTQTENAESTLDADLGTSATTVLINTGEGALFPTTYPFILVLEQFDSNDNVIAREIVECTGSPAADQLTIVRQFASCVQDETVSPKTLTNNPQSFLSGDKISLYFTAVDQNDLKAEVARLETDKLDISIYDSEKIQQGTSTTGTDAYAATISTVSSLVDGQRYQIKCDVSNTSEATLNINGLGAKSIKVGEDGALVELPTNTITAGTYAFFTYLSATDEFQYTSNEGNVTEVQPALRSFTLSETMTTGDLVKVINNGEIAKIIPNELDTIGSQQNFSTLDSDYCNAVALDQTRVFIRFENSAVIGTIDGTTITYGTTYAMSTAIYFGSSNLIGTDKVMITGVSSSGDSTLTCLVAEIDGDVITYGTSATNGITDADALLHATRLEDDKVFIAYSDNTAIESYGVIATVSGTNISFGTSVSISTLANLGMFPERVDTDKVIVAYGNNVDDTLYGRVATISGTSISFGTEASLALTNPILVSSGFVDTDKMFLAYRTGAGTGVILEASGTNVTIGTPVNFSGSLSTYSAFSRINDDPTRFILAYETNGTGANVVLGSVDGTDLTYDTPQTLTSDTNIDHLTVAQMKGSEVVFAYDQGSTNGEAQVVTEIGEYSKLIGVLQEGGVATESKNVMMLSGTSSIHTNLTPGDELTYGTALSSTEVLVHRNNI